jgi:hypothetical protein
MNRPVHAPVSPAMPCTPPPGHHARIGGPAACVATTAPPAAGRVSGSAAAVGDARRPDGMVLPGAPAAGPRHTARYGTGGGAAQTDAGKPTAAVSRSMASCRRRSAPRASMPARMPMANAALDPICPAITQPHDLILRAKMGVDAAGPGRQASRTCPRPRDPVTGNAGGRSAPPATVRDPRRIVHSPRAHNPCRNQHRSRPGARCADALALPPAHPPSRFGGPGRPTGVFQPLHLFVWPLTPGAPPVTTNTSRSWV